WPGGASDGSYMVGMVISIRGDREGLPYLASSQARSMYSTEGQICIVARCCGPGLPGNAVNSGTPLKARFILSEVPSVRNLRMPSTNSDGRSPVSIKPKNVRCG